MGSRHDLAPRIGTKNACLSGLMTILLDSTTGCGVHFRLQGWLTWADVLCIWHHMNIIEFLGDIPVNANLRERIATLLEDKQRLEKKIEALEKEKSDLIQEAGRLREELARKSASPDTVKHRGVVFKGVSKGAKGVEIDCAACGVALSSAPPRSSAPMFCPKCGFIAWFNRNGLDHVLSELPKP